MARVSSCLGGALTFVWNLVLDALFPRFCVMCGREGDYWCNTCGMIPVERRTALHPTQESMTSLTSLGIYAVPAWRKLIEAWKYHLDPQGKEVLEAWMKHGLNDYHPEVDVVTWVPLHVRKRRARGFDQAEWVAERVAKQVGLPLVLLMRRVRYGKARARTDRDKRSALSKVYEIISPDSVVGKRVLLCDDVCTTGETLGTVAELLKKAGAREIHGFVLVTATA